MDIKSIDQLKLALQAATRQRAQDGVGEVGDGGEPVASFGSALEQALGKINAMQEESAENQRAFQQGLPGASLESTMVSMQKSQVAFQTAVTVRNRLVSAYTDIMNMPV